LAANEVLTADPNEAAETKWGVSTWYSVPFALSNASWLAA
jgi:hypothetical protein